MKEVIQIFGIMVAQSLIETGAMMVIVYLCVKVIEIFLNIKYWIRDRMVRRK